MFTVKNELCFVNFVIIVINVDLCPIVQYSPDARITIRHTILVPMSTYRFGFHQNKILSE